MVHHTLSLLAGICLLTGSLSGSGANAQDAKGIQLYDPNDLDVTLGQDCIKALGKRIDCHGLVHTFTELRYRQSLGNVTLTDEVCSSGCQVSLKDWYNSVAASCAGKSVNDGAPTKFGGYMWAGFNETCVRDPRTKQYCNDIIANFTDVAEIAEMPQTELCHTCHVRRLALMQSSRYSIYDEFWKSQLEYIYDSCGGNGPTEVQPPLETAQPAPTPYCGTGRYYTTKDGDTCESIAKANSVSAAALYMTNQDIMRDCRVVEPGLRICLPPTCNIYTIQPSDTCARIERSLGLSSGQLRNYNSWLTALCTNLHTATNFYGKIICGSPPGGHFTDTAPPSQPTGDPTDGYTRNPIPPPEDATVAEGTTLNCGKWHQVAAEDFCSTICLQYAIDTKLFHDVNPSLKAGEECTASLDIDTVLCVGPVYNWNTSIPTTTTLE